MRDVFYAILKEDPSVARAVLENKTPEDAPEAWDSIYRIFKKQDLRIGEESARRLVARYVRKAQGDDKKYWISDPNIDSSTILSNYNHSCHIATVATPSVYRDVDGRETLFHLIYHAYPEVSEEINKIFTQTFDMALKLMLAKSDSLPRKRRRRE